MRGKKKESPSPVAGSAPAGGHPALPATEEAEEDKGEAEPLDVVAEDEGSEDVEEEAAGEAGGDATEEGSDREQNADEGRPTLGEGFYEIESIRRKRVRKGQLQYLIKWRGWPETANTWEPIENLTSCPEIISAFEERCTRSPRKGRRSGGKSQPASQSATSPEKKRKRTPSMVKHCSNEGIDRRSSERIKKKMTGKIESSTIAESMAIQELSLHDDQQPKTNETSTVEPTLSSPDVQVIPPFKDAKENPDVTGQVLQSHSTQVTGAKKRKSGCVRRFKQDSAVQEQETVKPGNDDVESSGGETANNSKAAEPGTQLRITKIINAVQYHAAITNGVQKVQITFKALRSDGKEVFVDDKELKANDPLVLIDFYEQHLRYCPNP